jgi:hypothetical protein
VSRTLQNGARLCIADVIDAGLEKEVAAAGVRIILVPLRDGGVRRRFLCSKLGCGQSCDLLCQTDEGFVCATCAGTRPLRTSVAQPIGLEPKATASASSIASRMTGESSRPSGRTSRPKDLREASGATRPGRPCRELVENCRRVRVNQLLSRFGPPEFDDSSGQYICRVGKSGRIVVASTKPRFGGNRWWLVCPSCQRRALILYSPRSLTNVELRCRTCWGLAYQSQTA